MDSIDLTWNAIKGENGFDTQNVQSNLTLPTFVGQGSSVSWSSSDETVITNDGKVTMGRVPQNVTLTATVMYEGIETIKKFYVTVPRDPALPTFTGTLTGSQTVMEGEEFKVTISLHSDDVSSFNAYRFTLSFNASKVEYVGISDPNSKVAIDGGKLEIYGIGTERPISDTITVTFRAKKSGITEVKLVKLEIDLNPEASLEELPAMNITEGAALIDVQKIGEDAETDAADTANDNAIVWVVIFVVAALAIGGVVVWLLIKKKKQTLPVEE